MHNKEKILFLDTETSGLNSTSDHIIEVGGVVANYNYDTKELEYVDSYQSLVFLETGLNSRITDLTGILKEELDRAPKRHIVQQQWRDFVELHNTEHPITKIVGHSVDFDMGFLNEEQWATPQNGQIIDTLDLFKIFYPEAKALNLDYISAFYDLQKYFPIRIDGLSHHRALYDTFLCAGLYSMIMTKTSTSVTDANLLELIENEFTIKITPAFTNKNNDENLKDNWQTTLTTIYQSLPATDKANNKISLYKRLIIQLWYAIANNIANIHINGSLEKYYIYLIKSSIYSLPLHNPNSPYILLLEDVLLNNTDLTVDKFSSTRILEYIKMIYDLGVITSQSPDLPKLKIVRSALLLQCQQLSAQLRVNNPSGFASIDKLKSDWDMQVSIKAISNIKDTLNELLELLNNVTTQSRLLQEAKAFLALSCSVIGNNNIDIMYYMDTVVISCSKNLDLRDAVSDIFSKLENIPTYLDSDNVAKLDKLLNLDEKKKD